MDRTARLLIWNQLEILKTLNPSDATNYESKQEIVASGYSSRYEEIFGQVTAEEASKEMQEEVKDILDMFRALSNATQSGWVPSDPRRAKFEGFDANNDDHYSFAGHLIDEAGLWPESAPNKNSHSSATLDRYRRMLERWHKVVNRYKLTANEAEAIIAP